MKELFNPADYRIVIGTYGDDSHNVGRSLIALALQEKGYQIIDLKLQNKFSHFLEAAKYGHAILISSLNGHANGLLHEEQRKEMAGFEAARGRRLWYIGGNLCIHEDPQQVCARFREMGFTEAYAKPGDFDLDMFLERLEKDLSSLGIVSVEDGFTRKKPVVHVPSNNRSDVLQEYDAVVGPLEETARRQQQITTRFAIVLQEAKRDGKTLIHPRCGVPSVEGQAVLFHKLKEAGADCLSVQVDSSTRHHLFKDVEELLLAGKEMNGYPLINFGVPRNKELIDRFPDVPLQVRHGSYDGRLLAEAGFASGFTAIEGGAICYNIPYFTDVSLETSIRTWQYLDRLSGDLTREGWPIDREFFGTLTATLIEPSIAITVNILEALLAAQNGVKYLSLGYAEQGNREQDIAAIHSLEMLTREYLQKYGHDDVYTSTVFHTYMAAFPLNQQMSEEIIIESAVTARLAGATRIMTKSPVESVNVPLEEANVKGVELTRIGFELSGNYDPVKVAYECALIERSVRSLVDSILGTGAGDPAKSIINAFACGYIDVPFSPSIYNAGKVKTLRDKDGAVRYFDPGNTLVPGDVLKEHRKLLEGRKGSYFRMLKEDLTRIHLSQISGWPLQDYYSSTHYNPRVSRPVYPWM